MPDSVVAFGAQAASWGPMSGWAAAASTFLVAGVALLVAMGAFDSFRSPRLRPTFHGAEPWCRQTDAGGGERLLWVRIGVENCGARPARGCVGEVTRLVTDGVQRVDIDPVQLRWAGFPRSRAYEPIDLRRSQQGFLNVLLLDKPKRWQLLTFEDEDFDPGFAPELSPGNEHLVTVTVFGDNVKPVSTTLRVSVGVGDEPPTLELVQPARRRSVAALRLR